MADKDSVIRILGEDGFRDSIPALAEGHGIFRTLISLTYDRESLVCWRAIEALGILAGLTIKNDPDVVRNLVQRLLWMMRDESGNNAGSAPEILGEIVRNCPDDLSDMPPILASFHEEEMLRKGVLRGLWRIAEARPDLCAAASALIMAYLRDNDPEVRAYAVLLAGALGLKEFIVQIEGLYPDVSPVRIYAGGRLSSLLLGKIAEETVIMLRAERAFPRGESRRPAAPSDGALRCPFCNAGIDEPKEIELRFGGTLTAGRCGCGAVYAYDRSGHNLGDTYVDVLLYAGNDNQDVWSLSPGEDYEIRELSYDRKRNRFTSGSQKSAATYLFIRMKNVSREGTSPGSG